jgi:hypothetical protein
LSRYPSAVVGRRMKLTGEHEVLEKGVKRDNVNRSLEIWAGTWT